ncbi:hypothetical protein T09_3207 [Trichinella sp. T9]|nr:hypothetical protein T09_3207 [Trichinella sp. T9]
MISDIEELINLARFTAYTGFTDDSYPKQYGGSSDWDDWLEHFEDVDAPKGKKHIPLVTTSTRSSYRSCVTSLKERLDPLSNAAVYCDELENQKRRAKDSWSDIGRDIRHLMPLDWINFSTLDRPELVLLVKQRNPKNIEEAVRAALEVESFMIRPGPGLLIGTSSQTPYNADPAKNETSADISRLTSCLERMQLRLEDIEQRMQAFQPKQRDRRGDYVTERAANEQQPERRTCYRCGRVGHLA